MAVSDSEFSPDQAPAPGALSGMNQPSTVEMIAPVDIDAGFFPKADELEPSPSPSPALTLRISVMQCTRQQRWVQEYLPYILSFATSVLVHLAIIIVGIATYKAASKIAAVVKEQITIPDAAMATGNDVGGIPNPGMSSDRDRTAGQDFDPTLTQSTGSSQVRAELNSTLMNTPVGGAPLSVLANLDGSPQALKDDMGNGSGTPAPFALPGGGQGIGPHGKVFGHGGNATKIVFICDGSGSMNAKMDALKKNLSESVDGLIARQAFDVIFFQEAERVTPASPKYLDLTSDLLLANSDNKQRLYGFLKDIAGRGQTYAIPAITTAFQKRTRPDLIYLLTDGAFEQETGDAVVAAIARLNADKKVKINTVLLTGSDIDAAELSSAKKTMEKIARDNGGELNVRPINQL